MYLRRPSQFFSCGSKTGRMFWRDMWLTTTLHESHQTLDDQREEIIGVGSGLHASYAPADLAIPWLLEKHAQIRRAWEEGGEEAFVTPHWLTKAHCKQQLKNIEVWLDAGSISEEVAGMARAAVETLWAAPALGSSRQASNVELKRLSLAAKVAPSGSDGAGPNLEEELDLSESPPPTPGDRLPAVRQPTRAESLRELGLPSTTLGALSLETTSMPDIGMHGDLAHQALALAKELATVIHQAKEPEDAALEWWDLRISPIVLNSTLNSDLERGDVVQELLVALVEELLPDLKWARIFVRL
mmetsp:Transcript_30105/g.80565  ORF Transcript_30105/g.80565 Transcript_30105/m.80565 type:complete len:300 (-) Transcript_30105:27-926(-)